MLRPLVTAAGLSVVLFSCKAKDDEPDPGFLRWQVTPSAGSESVFVAATFEHDYRKSGGGIHAEPHSDCEGGEVLGIGKDCTKAPAALKGAALGGTIEIAIEGAWRVGSIPVVAGKYVTPGGKMLRLRNGNADVSAAQRSATTKIGGAALVAYLCARGSAELVEGDAVFGTLVGTVRFAVAHESPHDRDVDPPSCSADL